MCFSIVGADFQRSLISLASVIPSLLLAIRAAQVIERNQMIGAELERLLKIADCFSGPPFARGQQAEVVPGICQSVGIARTKFERAFKALPGFCRLLLVQIYASDAIERFRACWIVAQGDLERSCGLIHIAALKKHRAVGKIIASELDRVGHAGKGKRPS